MGRRGRVSHPADNIHAHRSKPVIPTALVRNDSFAFLPCYLTMLFGETVPFSASKISQFYNQNTVMQGDASGGGVSGHIGGSLTVPDDGPLVIIGQQ